MDDSFDQTQAIPLDVYEDDTDDDGNGIGGKRQVSKLKVLLQKGFAERIFPVYEGDNVIGRGDNCDICIPLKALSREHACIEVKGDIHFLYDKGSRNKTRKGKHFLAPSVRYEVKDRDVLMFGDVEAVYLLEKEAPVDNESGSETESESMFSTVPMDMGGDEADTGVGEAGDQFVSPSKSGRKRDEGDSDSDASSNILEPSQKRYGDVTVGDCTADDSTTSNNVTVEDTPVVSKRSKKVKPDTDTENDSPTIIAATQGYVCESDTDEEEMDFPVKSALLAAETQAVGDDMSVLDTSKASILAASTQAFFMDEEDEEDEEEEGVHKSMLGAATQAYPGVLESTQAYDICEDSMSSTNTEPGDKTTEAAAPENKDRVKSDSESSEEFILDEKDVVDYDEQAATDMFLAPTLACDTTDMEVEEEEDTQEVELGDTQEVDEGDTQEVRDTTGCDLEAETQAVGNDDATQVFIEDQTRKVKPVQKIPVDQECDTLAVGPENATQVVGDKTEDIGDTLAVGPDDATLVIGDKTEAIGDTLAVGPRDATLVIGDKTEDIGDTLAVGPDDATLVIGDKTEDIGDTLAVGPDDATLVIGDKTEDIGDTLAVGPDDATLVIGDKTEDIGDTLAVGPEDATLVVGDIDTESNQATKKTGNRMEEIRDTLAIGPEDATQVLRENATEPFCITTVVEDNTKDTLAVDSDTVAIGPEDATQVFEDNEIQTPCSGTPSKTDDISDTLVVTESPIKDTAKGRQPDQGAATLVLQEEEEEEAADTAAEKDTSVNDKESGDQIEETTPVNSGEDGEGNSGGFATVPVCKEEEEAATQIYEDNVDPTVPVVEEEEDEEEAATQAFIAGQPINRPSRGAKRGRGQLSEVNKSVVGRRGRGRGRRTGKQSADKEDESASSSTVNTEQADRIGSTIGDIGLGQLMNTEESDDNTPPLSEEFVPDSEKASPLIPLPAKSPLKSSLASPQRKKSPSPKRVQFVAQSSTESESTTMVGGRKSDLSMTKGGRSARRGRLSMVEINQSEKNPDQSESDKPVAKKGRQTKRGRQSDISESVQNKPAAAAEKEQPQKPEPRRGRKSAPPIVQTVEEQPASKRKRGRQSLQPEIESSKGPTSQAQSQSGIPATRGGLKARKGKQSEKSDTGTEKAGTSTEPVTEQTEPEKPASKRGRPSKRGKPSEISVDIPPNDGEEETTIEDIEEEPATQAFIDGKPASQPSLETVSEQDMSTKETAGRRGRGKKSKKQEEPVTMEDSEEEPATQAFIGGEPAAVGKRGRGKQPQKPETKEEQNVEAKQSDAPVAKRGRQSKQPETDENSLEVNTEQNLEVDQSKSKRGRGTKRGRQSEQTDSVPDEPKPKEQNIEQTDQDKPVTKRGRRGRQSVQTESVQDQSESAEMEPVQTKADDKPVPKRGRQARGRQPVEQPQSSNTNTDTGRQSKRGRPSKVALSKSDEAVAETDKKPEVTETMSLNETGLSQTGQSENDSSQAVVKKGRQPRNAAKTESKHSSIQNIDPQSEDVNKAVEKKGRRTKRGRQSEVESEQPAAKRGKLETTATETVEETQSDSTDIVSSGGGDINVSKKQVKNRGRKSAAVTSKTEENQTVQSAADEQDTSVSISSTDKRTTNRGKKSAPSTSNEVTMETDAKPTKRQGKGHTGKDKKSSIDEDSVSQGDNSQSTPTSKGAKARSKKKTANSGNGGEDTSSDQLNSSQVSIGRQTDTPTRRGRADPDSSISNSPSLRQRNMDTKPQVLFTGVTDEHAEKVVGELGGHLAKSVMECSHLVTDQIRRTVKFLCSVSRGIPIVTPQWLASSKTAGLFLDTTQFLVTDYASEKKHKFSLKRSLEMATEKPLLSGYKIHVTKSVKPEPAQMKDILQCAGAKYVSSMPKAYSEELIVISCENDRTVCEPALKTGIAVVDAEFILTGILRQEVDVKQYALFESGPQGKGKKKR